MDYWQLDNKAARERGPGLVTAATMKILPEVRRRLQTHGWAVLDNICELFDETCKPSKEQCEYILKTNEDNKQVIFENAIWSDITSSIGLETKSERVGARMMLKQAGHSGKWAKYFVDYTRKYKAPANTRSSKLASSAVCLKMSLHLNQNIGSRSKRLWSGVHTTSTRTAIVGVPVGITICPYFHL